MPVTLSRGERKAMIWLIIACLALAVLIVVFATDRTEEVFYPSSYSPSSRGGKGAYLLLGQLGYTVTRWEHPLSELPQSGAGTMLILARPMQWGERPQEDALKRFLATGGRVLCFGLSSQWIVPNESAELNPVPETEWKEYSPAIPSRITRGGPITTDVHAHWSASALNDSVHYRSKDGPIVVSYPYGQGEVVWWGSTVPITNAGISRTGNLELVLNSIGGTGVHVLWNEYSGAESQSLWARAWDTPVKWLFAQGALFASVLLLTYSRRRGPLRAYPVRSRLSPLEFTETLGALYKRAHAAGFALEASYTHFRSQMASRYGIRRDASAEALARSLQDRFPALDSAFASTLREIEQWMQDSSLTEDKALELVQRLQEYAAVVKVGMTGEKN